MPFGGGAGMLMTPQPLYDCINAVKKLNPVVMKRKDVVKHITNSEKIGIELCFS